mmetsp:Transcript_24482/g.51279  ORF Transcript_24482/g.51279 Transcript_24482/m.51279 type:complete len:279 (+) Transcript_24482:363-1199(+)
MTSLLMDEALEQWDALVEREDAYKLQQPPSLPLERQDGQTVEAREHACPPVWREKICEWCYQVIDHCDIDRGVVSIALDYFDRFLSCQTSSSIAEISFQLVSMTALYLAAKLHSTRKISASSMSSLSKGCFRVSEILNMEVCIIQTLRWHLNPPTASIYLDVVNPLLDASIADGQDSYELAELSRYLLELGVCDSYFIEMSPSSIAYASIIVAMENLSTSKEIRSKFDLYQLDKSSKMTELCARRLRHVYQLTLSPDPEEQEEEPTRPIASPTSVLPE